MGSGPEACSSPHRISSKARHDPGLRLSDLGLVSRDAITRAMTWDRQKRNPEMAGGNRRYPDAHRLSLRSRLNQLQRLVGLLTRALTGPSCLPGLLQWRTARTLGTYSGGAVPESHRLPRNTRPDAYTPVAPGRSSVTKLVLRLRPASEAERSFVTRSRPIRACGEDRHVWHKAGRRALSEG